MHSSRSAESPKCSATIQFFATAHFTYIFAYYSLDMLSNGYAKLGAQISMGLFITFRGIVLFLKIEKGMYGLFCRTGWPIPYHRARRFPSGARYYAILVLMECCWAGDKY